jgi:hypothetical protein
MQGTMFTKLFNRFIQGSTWLRFRMGLFKAPPIRKTFIQGLKYCTSRIQLKHIINPLKVKTRQLNPPATRLSHQANKQTKPLTPINDFTSSGMAPTTSRFADVTNMPPADDASPTVPSTTAATAHTRPFCFRFRFVSPTGCLAIGSIEDKPLLPPLLLPTTW